MGLGAKNQTVQGYSECRATAGRALQTEETLWQALGDSTETLQQ